MKGENESDGGGEEEGGGGGVTGGMDEGGLAVALAAGVVEGGPAGQQAGEGATAEKDLLSMINEHGKCFKDTAGADLRTDEERAALEKLQFAYPSVHFDFLELVVLKSKIKFALGEREMLKAELNVRLPFFFPFLLSLVGCRGCSRALSLSLSLFLSCVAVDPAQRRNSPEREGRVFG
jgi:hypothetical protein